MKVRIERNLSEDCDKPFEAWLSLHGENEEERGLLRLYGSNYDLIKVVTIYASSIKEAEKEIHQEVLEFARRASRFLVEARQGMKDWAGVEELRLEEILRKSPSP